MTDEIKCMVNCICPGLTCCMHRCVATGVPDDNVQRCQIWCMTWCENSTGVIRFCQRGYKSD